MKECDVNPDHEGCCEVCGLCSECIEEHFEEIIKRVTKEHLDILRRIVAAHHQSIVDDAAIKEAEKLIKNKDKA